MATKAASNKIPVNDREAMERAIREYGSMGLIIAVGDVAYDDKDKTFQEWHEQLKGPPSRFVVARKSSSTSTSSAWSGSGTSVFNMETVMGKCLRWEIAFSPCQDLAHSFIQKDASTSSFWVEVPCR
ncbi:MAG: hypothetical protein FWG50_02780 [Kiritimatiellaeota bacterium]|nr:hypothetical protein [Kiritimatiellota bacterium]